MSEIKIDNNVPIPANAGRRGKGSMYPFSEMEVGDSFFVSRPQKTMTGSVSSAARKNSAKYTTRSVTENGVSGTRVWRIK